MITNLLPSVLRRTGSPLRRIEEYPFFTLHRGLNDVFDEMFRSFDLVPFEGRKDLETFYPSVDVREDEKEVTVKAELPGMDEKDIEVSITEDGLTLKGERKDEKEETGDGYIRKEMSYGSFCRVIPLPEGLDPENVDARFKKGVLTITLPRLEELKAKEKKIDVKTE